MTSLLVNKKKKSINIYFVSPSGNVNSNSLTISTFPIQFKVYNDGNDYNDAGIIVIPLLCINVHSDGDSNRNSYKQKAQKQKAINDDVDNNNKDEKAKKHVTMLMIMITMIEIVLVTRHTHTHTSQQMLTQRKS